MYLEKLRNCLLELKASTDYNDNFYIPDFKKEGVILNINPFDYFIDKINEINRMEPVNCNSREIVYNLLVRYTTAFDHNNDGKISIEPDKYGFRETGTFLKTIALLPLLKSMNVNVLYLLPVTMIGSDSKKGNLGSPYAIKDPYQLDENLSEPILGMPIEEQFSALIEAAHLLGMKVILEFVFRTSSLDSKWALEHPDWFYWIKSDISDKSKENTDENCYSAPAFSDTQITEIKQKIEDADLANLIEPDEKFKAMFTDVPEKVFVLDGKIFGITKTGTECRIPSAFADWPPNDTQPPWSDVTYLRLFDHPDFNYIAYNTIRMYDLKLNKSKFAVKPLWEKICGIIPYYQKQFKIDGVLLDMGHALPEDLRKELVNSALKENPDFVFWEENFSLNQKSVDDGYKAVVGYVPFDQHIPYKLKSLVDMIIREDYPIEFFLTPETHNTPRAAFRFGIGYSKMCWALNSLMPGILFIHSGFELGETLPINTGLDFTEEQISMFPSDQLPLFSARTMNRNPDKNLIPYMIEINDLIEKYLGNKKSKPESFSLFEYQPENLLIFKIRALSDELICVFNIAEAPVQNIWIDHDLIISNNLDVVKRNEHNYYFFNQFGFAIYLSKKIL